MATQVRAPAVRFARSRSGERLVAAAAASFCARRRERARRTDASRGCAPPAAPSLPRGSRTRLPLMLTGVAITAMPPVRRALASLAAGHVNVDVMDAVAIAVCMLRGDPINPLHVLIQMGTALVFAVVLTGVAIRLYTGEKLIFGR